MGTTADAPRGDPAIERRAIATIGLLFPIILGLQAGTLAVWRVVGSAGPPPAEWVSILALPVGLLAGRRARWSRRLAGRLPESLDHSARRYPAAAVVVALFALLALVQTGRVSAYMVDVRLTRDATSPLPPGARGHMCLPAYVEAAELARAGDANVYAESHYEAFAAKELLSLQPPEAYAHAAGDPMHPHPPRIEGEQERDIFGSLRCTCGCPRDPQNLLSTCSCPMAEAARATVRKQLAAGLSKEQILVAYRTANGPSSLATRGDDEPHSSVGHLEEYLYDPYEYPPPFLVLPRVALALTNDFLLIRSAWFALQALAIGALALAIARFIGGRDGVTAGLLLPALWCSTPFWLNLEFGQVHLLTLSLAMAGMVALEGRRNVLGGGLLAGAIVIKLTPALLVAYLIARGRWRATVAVMAGVAVYALLALAVLGPAPYSAFFHYQLPRLASGEAFGFFLGRPMMLATNLSLYALPLKLRGLGVPGMTLGVSSAVAWLYGLFLVLLAYVAARRTDGSPLDQAQRWLALLNLAALRSPLAPSLYVTSGVIWLLTLLAPTAGRRGDVGLVALWLYLSVVPLLPPGPLVLWDLTLAQVVVVVLNVWVAVGGLPRALRAPPGSTRRPRRTTHTTLPSSVAGLAH